MMKASQATIFLRYSPVGFYWRPRPRSDRRGKRNRRHQRKKDLRGEVVAEVVLARTDDVLDTV